MIKCTINGIYEAHFSDAENVTMVDLNPNAIEMARSKLNIIF